MRSIPRLVLLTMGLAAASVGSRLAAQPPAGSQLPQDGNNCLACHSEAALWEGENLRLYVSKESLAEDVHFTHGVNCHDCHGGNPASFDVPVAHSTEVAPDQSGVLPFRLPLGEVKKVCANCHKDEGLGLRAGAHSKAGAEGGKGPQAPMTCQRCHGEKAHGMLAVHDARSPVFLVNQVALCGGCHEKWLETYDRSVHGHGLRRAGLLVAAVCADCHGAHGIYPSTDKRSSLYLTNVAGMCGKCHRFIEERLDKSVHGRGNGLGGSTEVAALGGNVKRRPTCTDCHPGHVLASPGSVLFRLGVPGRCGDCHAELFRDYVLSVHGELTELGYGPAAKCSDCHGFHEILPVADPESTLSPLHRLATCRKCHPDAPPNFAAFDPHADPRDAKRDPLLYWVYVGLLSFLIGTMGFFSVHCVFWFVRGAIDVKKHGRPRSLAPGEPAYVRFRHFHRVAHTVMLVSFLGLALTGLPLKYSQYEWAQAVARGLGGFASTSLWHRFFGLVNLGCLLVYAVRLVVLFARPGRNQSRWKVVFGPNSTVPNIRDLKDFGRMVRWFGGRGPKPTFDRWAYWEKVDFWGASADIVIIGLTGLIMWFPNFFCSFLPGEALNIAKVIHSTQALLATAFVFAIHFFATHLRPEKFPMDMSVLTGLVSEEELEHERPEYLERMRRDGTLQERKARVPSRGVLRLISLGGYVALALGVSLLVGIVAAIIGG